MLRSTIDSIACVLFPGTCRVCGDALVRLGPVPVCEVCIDPVPAPAGRCCATCGENFGLESFPGQHLSQPENCRACESVPPPFTEAVSYAAYEGGLRSLIHMLKYEGVTTAARPLGKMLAAAVEKIDEDALKDAVVVVVPLHPRKEKQRGFNQSQLLAEEAVREMRGAGATLKMTRGVLRRGRPTESQFGLSPRERRRNLKGAFTVRKVEAIRGKTVLLVDDIYTTGATARECSRTLLEAGAGRVYLATLTRAQSDGVAGWDAAQFVTVPVTFNGEGTLTAR